MKKRFFAAVLCAMLLMTLLPTAALADAPTLTINSSTVAFGGREWYVIGNGSTGVNPVSGNITLLAKEASGADATAFRSLSMREQSGYTEYSRQGLYFADNPSGLNPWSAPSEYAGSTLQQKMEARADALGTNEKALITARDLTTSDGISNQGISGQKYWALSEAECTTIANDATNGGTVLSNSSGLWWLRSPNGDLEAYCAVGMLIYVYSTLNYARPAFNLNLESVLFTSSAATGGKSSAAAGGGFVSAAASAGAVKFTMLDSSRNFTAATTEVNGNTLTVSYENATVGANEYVSALIKDGDGAVTHYAKLAQPANAADTTTLTLPEDFDAETDTVYVFSEQANGDLYTDFASGLITVTANAAPTASNVSMTGLFRAGETLTGHYTYSDADGDLEGTSTFKWYRSESSDGYGKTPIAGANAKTYVLTSADEGKYISFEVTPVAATGETQGAAVESSIVGRVAPAPTVTTVTVTPATASVEKGGNASFTATVTGTNYPDETVTWSVEGNNSSSTNISTTGTLTVGSDEMAATLTVKATSTVDSTKSGTAAVTVTTSPIPPDPDPIEYDITDGANGEWTKGHSSGLGFTANADYSKFTNGGSVLVDNATISSDHYTSQSGSTIVTLKASYLETLSVGKHTLRVNFTDGHAETSFTVKAAVNPDNPSTGDKSQPLLWLGIALMAGAGLAAGTVIFCRRRQIH